MDSEKQLADALADFNRAKAKAELPVATVKRVSKRDAVGRIEEVTETPVASPTIEQVTRAATAAVEAAAAVVESPARLLLRSSRSPGLRPRPPRPSWPARSLRP